MLKGKIKLTLLSTIVLIFASFYGVRTSETYANELELQCSELAGYCCYNIYDIRITGGDGKVEWECTSGGSFPVLLVVIDKQKLSTFRAGSWNI